MNVRRLFLGAALLAATALPCSLLRAADLDIKRIAPVDAHTIVYAKHNPEREYQAAYLADAWKTFQDERIAERVFDLISSRAPKEKLAEITDRWKEIQTALEPLNLAALNDAKEFVMFNSMVGPFGHTVVAIRLSDEDAEDYRNGVGNLFAVFQKWSEGKVVSESTDVSGAKITVLRLPKESPYQPAVACIDDLFLIGTTEEVLKASLAQLQDPSAKSKFDDERLKSALAQLPEPEDTLTFFDADQLFKGMRGLGDFIRKESASKDEEQKEKAERAIGILNRALDEVDIIEYEVTVQYTDEGRNHTAALGKASEGIKDTLLGRAITSGQPFEDWQSWVPANATAYSLGTGVNLHELYVNILSFVREEIPESHDTLDQWDALQEKVGVNLDEDILQSFSGENVSITLADQQSVSAFKCSNPDKIRELLDRAIEGLKQIPQAQAQGIDLVDCDDAALEGFQELRAAALAMTPAKPVLGFKDGWMIFASSPAAAKTYLAVRAGEEKSIKDSDSLKKFGMKTDGDAYSVSYSDVGAGVRAAVAGINQFAMMAPMFVGTASQGAKPEDKKAMMDAIGLLPSIAKVVGKFDFYEQKLSITAAGPSEGMYRRDSVMLIRQPEK